MTVEALAVKIITELEAPSLRVLVDTLESSLTDSKRQQDTESSKLFRSSVDVVICEIASQNPSVKRFLGMIPNDVDLNNLDWLIVKIARGEVTTNYKN